MGLIVSAGGNPQSLPGAVQLDGIPAIVLSASQNNFAPAGVALASIIPIVGVSAINITGLQAGAAWELKTLANSGTTTITLKNADGASSEANRFSFGSDYALTAGSTIAILYNPHLQKWIAASQSTGGGGLPSWPPVTQSPDVYPDTQESADDEFDPVNFTEPTLDTAGTRFTGATPWAWFNQGGASAAIANGLCTLTLPASVAAEWRGIVQAVAGPFKRRLKISGASFLNTGDAEFGIAVKNAGGAFFVMNIAWPGGFWNAFYSYWTNATTYSGHGGPVDANPYFDTTGGAQTLMNFPCYVEVEATATDLIFRYSPSGEDNSFVEFYSEALADHIGVIDGVGFLASITTTEPSSFAIDWFREPQ